MSQSSPDAGRDRGEPITPMDEKIMGPSDPSTPLDGSAVVHCAGAFSTTYGKTAHGLVRRTSRYRVMAVIDPLLSGRDAGEFLDGRASGIPIVPDLPAALDAASRGGFPAGYFLIGIAPDGGRLSGELREAVRGAIEAGLRVDAGLHDFIGEDPELAAVARERGVELRDVRRTPPRDALHAFTGKIEEVGSLRVAVLGTDSAIGKRTTAWGLVEALNAAGMSAEMVGTGQTAWLQGARYSIMLDSLVNDFIAGELEHAVWQAWTEVRPQVIVVEGQGSLMNPAYPGGFEILAAARPHCVILQHAPARDVYDGFPDFPLHPLPIQIQAIELISGRPVVAVTINHENMTVRETRLAAERIEAEIGLPAMDVLLEGPDRLVEVMRGELARVAK